MFYNTNKLKLLINVCYYLTNICYFSFNNQIINLINKQIFVNINNNLLIIF